MEPSSVGVPVPEWTPPPRPPREPIVGRHCRVEPLNIADHAAALFATDALDAAGQSWTYLPYGPFATLAEYTVWLERTACGDDPLFHTLLDAAGAPIGVAAYLRIDPANGTIEVGHVHFSPLLQRTVAATEAMYLMMRRAFALGYRRYEWKCNALNMPSRRAAQRFGLSYEGIFRQAAVIKGHNRDTAWFAAIDGEWPALEAAFERWLDPANFDESGRQRVGLGQLTAPILVARDPALG